METPQDKDAECDCMMTPLETHASRTFKSKREINRDILYARIKKKLNGFSKRLEQVENEKENDKLNSAQIIHSGGTDYLEVDKERVIVVQVSGYGIVLKKDMKIMVSLTSNDDENGGFMYYLKDFEDGDTSFKVVVENRGEERKVKLSYIICH